MKGGNSGKNGSDHNKGNILKPTFNTLMRRLARRLMRTEQILKSSSSYVAR
jgi:hypothetical protein